VALGVLFLLAFFASYMMALSWADLTYVLPATSVGYVLLALIAKFFLHEQVSATRWFGILLISAGVAFAASGPSRTHIPPAVGTDEDETGVKAAAVSIGLSMEMDRMGLD
jgi:drug/metabolite transporter (DMT)-like permease